MRPWGENPRGRDEVGVQTCSGHTSRCCTLVLMGWPFPSEVPILSPSLMPGCGVVSRAPLPSPAASASCRLPLATAWGDFLPCFSPALCSAVPHLRSHRCSPSSAAAGVGACQRVLPRFPRDKRDFLQPGMWTSVPGEQRRRPGWAAARCLERLRPWASSRWRKPSWAPCRGSAAKSRETKGIQMTS